MTSFFSKNRSTEAHPSSPNSYPIHGDAHHTPDQDYSGQVIHAHDTNNTITFNEHSSHVSDTEGLHHSNNAIFSFLDDPSTEVTTSFAFPGSEEQFTSFDFSNPSTHDSTLHRRTQSHLSDYAPMQDDEHSEPTHHPDDEHSVSDNFYFSFPDQKHDAHALHEEHSYMDDTNDESTNHHTDNDDTAFVAPHHKPAQLRKSSINFDSMHFQDESFVNSFFLQENGQTRRQSLDPQHIEQLEREQAEHEKRLAERGDLTERLGMIAVPTPSVWASAFTRARNLQGEGFPDKEGSDRNPFALFDDHARFRRDSFSNNSTGFSSNTTAVGDALSFGSTSAATTTTSAPKIPERREQPYFPPPPGVDPHRLPFPPIFMANFSHRNRSDDIVNPLSRKRRRPDDADDNEPKKKQQRKRQATGATPIGAVTAASLSLEEPRFSNAKMMELVEGFFQEPKEKVLSGKTNRSPVHPHRLRVQVGHLGEEILKKYSIQATIHGYHKLTKTKTESLGLLQKISFAPQSESLNWRKEEGVVFVVFRDMIVKHSSHNHGQKLFIRFSLIDSEDKAIDYVDSADFSTITRRGVEKRRQKKTKVKMAQIEMLEKGIHTPNVTSSDPGFVFADAPQMIKLYGSNFGALRVEGLKVFFGDQVAQDIFSIRSDMILLEVGPLKQGTVEIRIEQDGKVFKSEHTIPVLPANPQHLSPRGPALVPLGASNGSIVNHNVIHSLSSTLSPKSGAAQPNNLSPTHNGSPVLNGNIAGTPPTLRVGSNGSNFFPTNYAADATEHQNPALSNGNGIVRHDSVQYRPLIK